MAATINKTDKAIDLEMRRQELREETLKEIESTVKESNRLHDKVMLLPEVHVNMSSGGEVYIAEVTSTEARIYHDSKRVSQVQLITLNTDMLGEILMAIHASLEK